MSGNNGADWLRAWLEDWAEWFSRESGWSSCTTEYRLARVQTWGDGQSAEKQLPKGVVPPGGLNRLIQAMQIVGEQGGQAAYEVAVMRAYYLAGKGEKAQQALSQLLGKSFRTVKRHKLAGERRIKDALRAK